MKKETCGHCICWFGGPTALPPFAEGKPGKCCRCGEINKNEKEIKEHFKQMCLMSGQSDLYLDFERVWEKLYSGIN